MIDPVKTRAVSHPKEDNWFFALQPDAAAQKMIVDCQAELRLRHGLRGYLIKPQNLQVIVQRLGAGALPENEIAAACAAAASVACRPFEITFDHARTFDVKQDRKPFVLGGDEAVEALHAFRRALGAALQKSGLRFIRPRFTPHLTLCWDSLVVARHPVPPIRWTATEFVLVRSRVGQAEPIVVGRWRLSEHGNTGSPFAHPKERLGRLTCPARSRPAGEHEYVELHARSAFSFLRGASIPEDLVRCADELRLPAMALLDRDGVYGAPRFYSIAHENGFAVKPRVGAEITMEDGSVVPLLATSRTGYQNLCQLITEAKLVERPRHLRISDLPHVDPRDRKRPCFATWDELARFSEGLIALTGDEEGPVRRAWRTQGAAAAAAALEKLAAIFAPQGSASSLDPSAARLFVELQRHRLRGEEREISFLRDLAAAHRLPLLATGGVNYAVPDHQIVADVFTCLRLHTTLDAAGRRLDINTQRHVKSAAEMAELFRDLPDALANSVRLDQRLAFTLENLGYEFPTFPTPDGQSMDAYLRAQTFAAAYRKIGALSETLEQQLNRELELVARLKFSGYFLIVWDICRWAREHNILVQGRGSAANSAVCYMLGITAVNPVKHRLLFDRFLNDSRVGKDGKPSWPDIDLDFPSGERREKVIQEVYSRYGRRGAAMTANVITYRGRNSVREVGKVLGFGEDALDRFSSLYANGDFPETLQLQQQLALAGIAHDHPRAAAMVRLQHFIRGAALPRHLGQHSGGMVICAGQLDKVVPLEPATMPDRSVCQWDKEDCENLGIVKIDFLGLGMMAVMQETIELCAKRADGQGPSTLDDIPVEDPETYEKIRAADTVGVFQIESRAQMATLPRFKPRNIYDLAMQVAIVRPGPITGHLVHPLIRRRDGLEKPDYIDDSVADKVEPILKRTMGVILFQEQMLEISMALAKFTGAEAEELRRAMGFTKGDRLPKALAKLKTALRQQGCNDIVVKKIADSAQSFAAYGFPESHAIGFAMLAYGSTWLKIHRPAEFYASLLNNQPMGFYSPATLLQDAKRGGRDLQANPVCVCASRWECTVEGDRVLRIGLRYVKGIREEAVKAALAARDEKPFCSLDDFLRRTNFSTTERRALAAVGALNTLAAHNRRTALWQVEAAWSDDEALFKHFAEAYRDDSPLSPMSPPEELHADFLGLGLTTGEHPMAALRDQLTDVIPAKALKDTPNGLRVTIAGSVICRQRPGTAKGFVFISLEDETGIANAVVVPALFERLRLIITQEPALRITGPLQNVSGVQHVKAEIIEPLREANLPAQASHDFH
jgi:error-prone DNA polymerase